MYFDIAKTVVQNDSKKVPVPCGSGGDRQSLIQLWTRINKSSLIELSSYLSEVMSDTNPIGMAIVGSAGEMITCGANRGLIEALLRTP